MPPTSPPNADSEDSGPLPDLTAGPGSLAFVTPCSEVKDTAEGLLPAIERYRDSRIGRVRAAAQDNGADFLILSGKFGLLEAVTPIPYYDHLLIAPEVLAHAAQVARQLRQRQVVRLVFFSDSPEKDPLLLPYLACLEEAGEQAGVAVTFLTLTPSSFAR